MMKVLHIASGDLWAGAEKQLYTLLTALAQSGQVEVMAIILNPGTLAKKIADAGIDHLILDESRQGLLSLYSAINRYVEQKRPDVIHTHRQKENTLGGLVAARHRIPSVRTQHGSSEHGIHGLNAIKRLQRSAAYLVGRYCQRQIIAVSEPLANELHKQFSVGKVVVIHNGIDMDDAPSISPDSRNSSLIVGIVGRLVPVKRVDLFIQVAHQVLEQCPEQSPPLFRIIGDGPLQNELKKQAQSLGLIEQIEFCGYTDNAELAIAELDVLVLCSDHEGLPMVSLEAMKHGTLVMSHNIGGLPQLLGNGEFGCLVPEQSVEQFADAIIDVVLHRPSYQQRVEQAKRQLIEHYSAETMARQHIKLYQQLHS